MNLLRVGILFCVCVIWTPPREWPADSVRMVDGDTVAVVIDLGFDVLVKQKVRVIGVDAPEHDTDAGKAVMKVVQRWLDDRKGKVFVRFVKPDKYAGRFDGDLFGADGKTLGEYLIENELAREYDGGVRAEWGDKELASIEKAAKSILESVK